MALVMLPCDLPWWESVKIHLNSISQTKTTMELINSMQKIHELCNISLDPDEDKTEPNQFVGLADFLDNDLSTEEKNNFFNKTLPNIVYRALRLKELKPKAGLYFSLQQQPDCTELECNFVSSLVANALFCTFPRRTEKSHPTLKDFNFVHFFNYLHLNVQKSKLRSILYYFDWLENNENSRGHLKIMRQVMSGREWLTIEDWLECSLPLCTVLIKHDGKMDRAESNVVKVCFASSKIGGNVLTDGGSQECISFVTFPEIVPILLNVEALEDNEVLTIENVTHVTKISDPKQKANLEKIDNPYQTTICCMDADDYTKLPIGQYEEDNVLRELNKCLLGFQQKETQKSQILSRNNHQPTKSHRTRRLSPIGESSKSTQSNSSNFLPLITQDSCSTTKSISPLPSIDNNIFNNNNNKLKVQIDLDKKIVRPCQISSESLVHNRRGKFIVLGSSGECLPVTRNPLETSRSIYSSCESSDEEFHSAKTSIEDSDEENYNQRYSIDLGTADLRHTFAQKLKDALNKDSTPSTSTSESSSYAVGISVTGSNLGDRNIKVHRDGSTGFALKEDSLDEEFLQDSLQQERQWINKFKNKHHGLSKKGSNKSSDYSFSSEYSSELEEMYDQFARWLDHPMLETEKGTKKELDSRELAVVRFAGSLLKRTLSESFAGVTVPLTEELDSTSNGEHQKQSTDRQKRLVLNAKSLSLELARHKHKLAAQLLSQLAQTDDSGPRSVATGNWGCGSSRKGDVQLKVIIQWLAASVAGLPTLVYYTCGHQQLSKLDTVCRILLDRKWSVKDLTRAILRYSNRVLHGREISGNLFQELIGMEKTAH